MLHLHYGEQSRADVSQLQGHNSILSPTHQGGPQKIGRRDSPAGFKNKKKIHCEKDLIYCSQPSGQQNVTH